MTSSAHRNAHEFFMRALADHRRELAWYHEVRAYRSPEGFMWIMGRIHDHKVLTDD